MEKGKSQERGYTQQVGRKDPAFRAQMHSPTALGDREAVAFSDSGAAVVLRIECASPGRSAKILALFSSVVNTAVCEFSVFPMLNCGFNCRCFIRHVLLQMPNVRGKVADERELSSTLNARLSRPFMAGDFVRSPAGCCAKRVGPDKSAEAS